MIADLPGRAAAGGYPPPQPQTRASGSCERRTGGRDEAQTAAPTQVRRRARRARAPRRNGGRADAAAAAAPHARL